MTTESNHQLFDTLLKIVYLTTGLILVILFLSTIIRIILVFLAALFFAIALNPIVTALEKRKINRILAVSITLVMVFMIFIILGILIVPRIINETAILSENSPNYISTLIQNLLNWFKANPEIRKQFNPTVIVPQLLPTLQTILARIGLLSVSLINLFIFAIVFISSLIYALAYPQPLLETYVYLFPPHLREKAIAAFINGSKMIVGWIWSNFIIGVIEGVVTAIFLTLYGIPGAVIWGYLNFVAEFIPRIGPYLAIIPPLIIAFAIDPVKALWIIVFYVVLNETMDNLLAPYIRSAQISTHPVLVIFIVTVMAYEFGFLGALIAIPVGAFIKAFYLEFYLKDHREKDIEEDVARMLQRKLR